MAEWRAAFDRMQEMETAGFAREQARLLDPAPRRKAGLRGTRGSNPARKHHVQEEGDQESVHVPRKSATGPYYALKITLAEVEPPVWRRIVISGNRTLTGLDHALQAAMGWTHSHLHCFVGADGARYSDPMFELEGSRDQGRVKIKDVLPRVGARLRFEYDFGDSWTHEVVVEQINDEHAGREPLCFDGERACPPEDVGGVPGYEGFLAAIGDPNDERHDELRQWYAGTNPEGREEFDPEQVDFDRINLRLARPPRLHRSRP